MTGTLAVTSDALVRAGRDLVGTSDAARRDIRANSGAQDGDTAANTSFALAQALTQCEQTWEKALTEVVTKLAVAGDTLELNARTYADAEQAARSGLTRR
ncbi:hypothetical protein JOF53_005445 [Crossiella equi]|uniref:Excreted virulence factor EspC (Type VII ESX diderm) n=1 Tax=Crossiella equi TaxID=130796 RepID=A0ABS5AJ17_9PSEU|nr:hypothetical protein [Crossiella equi]MBP2476573.1 hypothetical protein [Crossiella equi]